jgi:dienelactone hydrolase
MQFSKILFPLSFLILFLNVPVTNAEIVEKKITYMQGETKLIGYEYYDSEIDSAAPGVIVFSDWMGVGEFAKERAKELVDEGYRAFVADIYGEGKQAANQKEAGELATKFKSDRTLFRARAKAALDAFVKDPLVDQKHLGAIGFCFGGTAALELARTGAPIQGVVSFHGGLDTPDLILAKNIKARLLILHGADDPYVPEKEVLGFEDEMRKAGVTWELTKYSNTVHAFTNPNAGTDNSKGAAYNKLSSDRAFTAMRDFFLELFDDMQMEDATEISTLQIQ